MTVQLSRAARVTLDGLQSILFIHNCAKESYWFELNVPERKQGAPTSVGGDAL